MSGRQRLLIILLVCSLAINLLLVGGIVGRMMAGPPPRPLPDHLGGIVRLLDEERRAELREGLVQHWRNARPIRQEMRAAQRDVAAAIGAREFDPDSARRALDNLRAASLEYQQASHAKLVNVLSRLTPEERERVVQFLNRQERDLHPRRDGGPRNGGPRNGGPKMGGPKMGGPPGPP